MAIPAGVSTARLHFWRYRLWGDGAAASAPLALPATEAELPNAALDTDFFYVLAIRANGAIVWLLVERLKSLLATGESQPAAPARSAAEPRRAVVYRIALTERSGRFERR